MRRLSATLSLFTSFGTLICCALPALLVTLGMGAALAGLIGAVPQLIWFSEHKAPIFATAGIMLLTAGVLQWKARSLPCPTDPKLRDACTQSRRWSVGIYFVSLVIYAVGVFFAFVAPLVLD